MEAGNDGLIAAGTGPVARPGAVAAPADPTVPSRASAAREVAASS